MTITILCKDNAELGTFLSQTRSGIIKVYIGQSEDL